MARWNRWKEPDGAVERCQTAVINTSDEPEYYTCADGDKITINHYHYEFQNYPAMVK